MTESRIKNTGKNIIFSFLFQFLKILLVFINRIIFVRILGASFLGVNGLFTNILSFLSLVDLGMSTAMMYSLYELLAKKDEEKILMYMKYFKKAYRIIAFSIFILGLMLIPFLKYIVNLPSDMPNIYIYYILLLLNTVASYLFIYQTTIVSADQKNYILNKYDIIFQFVLFILQILALLITKSFIFYLMSQIICTILCNVAKVRASKKLYPYLSKESNEKLSSKERKKIHSNVFSLFFYKLGGIIITNTDNILISIFVGTIAVGYYSNYCTIVSSITTFLTMIFTSIKASLGNYIVKRQNDEQLHMFEILEIYNFWLVCFCSICFWILIPDFIEICFGKEYVLTTGLLACVVLNFYTSNIRQTIWAYRETTGTFNKTKYVTLVTAILNIILSIIFGYFFGLVGIIFATVLSRMLYSWWKEPLIIFREHFNTSPKRYYINYIKRFCLFLLIGTITFGIILLIDIPNLYLLFIVKMLICVTVPIILLGIFYRNSDAMKYLKNIVIEWRKK